MGQAAEERMTTEIDRTRQSLSRDVDALYDKVSPSRVVQRRKSAVQSRMSSVKDSVMGNAHGAAHGTADSVQGAAQSVQDTAGSALHAVERRAEGAPLAAGLVAFGAGMIAAALVPASAKEAEVAGRLTDTVKDSPVLDEAKAAGREIGESLKDSAAEAAQEVKQSAQGAAEHVQEEGRSSAEEVKQAAPGT